MILLLVEDSYTYPICINGKKKELQDFSNSLSKEEIETAVLKMESIQKYIEGKEIRKVIIVPKRMINIVV